MAQATESCLYTNIYNSGEKTWLLLNTIEKLSLLNFANETEFAEQWRVAQQQVQTQCGESLSVEPRNISFESGKTSFSIDGFAYYILKQTSGQKQKTALFKTTGNIANKNLMSVVYNNGQKEFVHIVGRDGKLESVDRFDFVYAGVDAALIHQSRQDFTNTSLIKSMKSIYGSVPTMAKVKLPVGIIGSGLDYNHPNFARRLKHRYQIESDLQTTDALRDDLQTKSYWSAQDLIDDKNEYLQKMQVVGFPEWMDQALGGIRPFDTILINPDLGGTGDHETRITSRIISRGDAAIQLHFARRMFGPLDLLNVEEVVENFYREGVRIVNMSFGSTCGLLPLEEAQWNSVFRKYSDMIFVVAVGNHGLNVDEPSKTQCPSNFSKTYKNVISVTALGTAGELAVYNGVTVNFGKSVDVAIKADNLSVLAPFSGADAWIQMRDGGTSVAASEVTRVLVEALLDGYTLDAQKVKSLLMSTSTPVSHLKNKVASGGEINVEGFRQRLQKK